MCFLCSVSFFVFFFFFFNDTATTEIYTLSLHDALPIFMQIEGLPVVPEMTLVQRRSVEPRLTGSGRSEEHTSELQSPCNLVCRLLLEKKKKNIYIHHRHAIYYPHQAVSHNQCLSPPHEL